MCDNLSQEFHGGTIYLFYKGVKARQNASITSGPSQQWALINNWVETQLIVTESSARIIGYGYAYEIAGAFSDLVLDWEATILLSQEPGLEAGQYDLSMLDEGLFAFKDQQRFPLADQSRQQWRWFRWRKRIGEGLFLNKPLLHNRTARPDPFFKYFS